VTTKDLLDLLMGRLGSRTQANLRVTCLAEMRLAQERLEAMPDKAWFLWKVVPVNLSTLTHDLGAEFLGFDDTLGGLWVKPGTDWANLERVPHEQARAGLWTTSDAVQAWDLQGSVLSFYPGPLVGVMPVEVGGYFKQAVLNDAQTGAGSTNGWTTHESSLLLATAGEVVASTHLQHPQLAEQFSRLKGEAAAQLSATNVSRKHGLMRHVMGGRGAN
jgi:hypothetical protein